MYYTRKSSYHSDFKLQKFFCCADLGSCTGSSTVLCRPMAIGFRTCVSIEGEPSQEQSPVCTIFISLIQPFHFILFAEKKRPKLSVCSVDVLLHVIQISQAAFSDQISSGGLTCPCHQHWQLHHGIAAEQSQRRKVLRVHGSYFLEAQ